MGIALAYQAERCGEMSRRQAYSVLIISRDLPVSDGLESARDGLTRAVGFFELTIVFVETWHEEMAHCRDEVGGVGCRAVISFEYYKLV